MVEITPELQAQLDAQKASCIFCKIITGEMESTNIFDTELISGVLDINPALKGHSVFMPKEHYPIMPYLPPATFKYLFGKMAALTKAIQDAMVATAANIFIANGGVAGQQAQHFLVHVLPREEGDGLSCFDFDNHIPPNEKEYAMLGQNLQRMMANHFLRNPTSWSRDQPVTAPFLSSAKKIYEDKLALCAIPEQPICKGHLVIYSQEEESVFGNLSEESSSHLFYLASFCATAVFEGLEAQGTNIILKTGKTNDNYEGKLCIHIIPRWQDDGLNLMWTPMASKPDLKDVASKITDYTLPLAHVEQKPVQIVEPSAPGDLSPSEADIRRAIDNVSRQP